jgi:hypothetical protein
VVAVGDLHSLIFVIATFPLAGWLWGRGGVATWQIGVALLIETFSFAALLAGTALMALPIMASVAVSVLSPSLAMRRETYYRLFSSHAARGILDWICRVLPPCSELEDMCALIQNGTIASWWPPVDGRVYARGDWADALAGRMKVLLTAFAHADTALSAIRPVLHSA